VKGYEIISTAPRQSREFYLLKYKLWKFKGVGLDDLMVNIAIVGIGNLLYWEKPSSLYFKKAVANSAEKLSLEGMTPETVLSNLQFAINKILQPFIQEAPGKTREYYLLRYILRQYDSKKVNDLLAEFSMLGKNNIVYTHYTSRCEQWGM
jgi:hypothetical protein